MNTQAMSAHIYNMVNNSKESKAQAMQTAKVSASATNIGSVAQLVRAHP